MLIKGQHSSGHRLNFANIDWKMILFVSIVAVFGRFVVADELVHVQVLFRHGDRAPDGTYDADPYQADAWPVPWGELTNDGMSQHFTQGKRLQKRYIQDLKFVPEKYRSNHIYVRSTDVDRTLMSAYANLAGFYSTSNDTHPADGSWPSNWSPVPVHTVDHGTDRLLNVNSQCIRMEELEAEQVANLQFVKFMAENADVLMTILQNTGIKVTEFKQVVKLFDAINIEQKHNMTLPAWITPEFFKRVETMIYNATDYVVGAAGFGRNEEVELIRLKAGVLLKEMIGNMEYALNGQGPLYRVYSAHDTTVQAFLMTLEAKKAIMGNVLPDFAATVAVELWKDQSNFAYVKLWYSDNAQTELRDVTSTIGGCGGGDTCTYKDFTTRSAKFVEVDFEKACLKL